jgi:hypothetical protein
VCPRHRAESATILHLKRPATWWKIILGCVLLFMAAEGSLQMALRDTAGALGKLAALLILIIVGGWLMASGAAK